MLPSIVTEGQEATKFTCKPLNANKQKWARLWPGSCSNLYVYPKFKSTHSSRGRSFNQYDFSVLKFYFSYFFEFITQYFTIGDLEVLQLIQLSRRHMASMWRRKCIFCKYFPPEKNRGKAWVPHFLLPFTLPPWGNATLKHLLSMKGNICYKERNFLSSFYS